MFFKNTKNEFTFSGKEKITIIIKKSHGFRFIGYQVASGDFAMSKNIEAGYEFMVEGESDYYDKDNKTIKTKVYCYLKIDGNTDGEYSNIIGGGEISRNEEKNYVYINVNLNLRSESTKDLYDLFSRKAGLGFSISGYLVNDKHFVVNSFFAFDKET